MFYTAEEISTNIADDLLYINDPECRSMFNNVIENTNKEETLKSGFIRWEKDLTDLSAKTYVGYGLSERPMDYWEATKYNGITAASSLETEKTHQIDAGILWNSGKVKGSISAFYAKVDDYILTFSGLANTSRFDTTTSNSGNVQATRYGAEADVAYQLTSSLQRSANWMKTSWIENKGNGQFAIHPLPKEAQFAPAYGLLPFDINQDGLPDIVMVGNDHGMEVQQGRADAAIGLILQNEGQGNFRPLSLEESHFFVPGDAKSLALLGTNREKPLLIASQNQGPLKVYSWPAQQQRMIPVIPEVVRAVLAWPDGSQRVQEFYWGNTFQSQSGRYLFLPPGVEVQYFNQQGEPIENEE